MNSIKLTNRRILVTGGLGFIGKSFTQKLLQKNVEVFVLDDFSNGKRDRYTKGAKIIKGDTRDMKAWKQIPPCDYVYHFGSPSSVDLFNADLAKSVDITLLGFINAFEWSLDNKVKKIIYPSSGSIFGKNKGSCSEKTVPKPSNTYGETKLACEYISEIYDEKVPSLGFRIFAGYGPQEDHKGEIASVLTKFIKSMLNNKSPILFGDGKQNRDFVYIDDIVDILLKAPDPKLTGVLNVGSGKALSFNKLIGEINKLLGTSIKPKYVPKPNKYLERLRCNTFLFEKYLGKKPIPIRSGLKKYLKALEINS